MVARATRDLGDNKSKDGIVLLPVSTIASSCENQNGLL